MRIGNAAADAVPARRLGGGARRAAQRPAGGPPRRRRRVGPAGAPAGLPGEALARARQRAVGDARAAPALRALQGDGVGRRSTAWSARRKRSGLPGPLERWRAAARRSTREVCARGYDAERGTFTQYYGSRGLDAALLLLPRVGFLPPDDPRVVGTVAAVSASSWPAASCCATSTRDADGRDRRRPARRRGRLPGLHLLARRRPRRTGRDRGGRRLFERLLACATTSACSARSGTRWPGANSATPPRRSATSGWSTPPATSTDRTTRTSGAAADPRPRRMNSAATQLLNQPIRRHPILHSGETP